VSDTFNFGQLYDEAGAADQALPASTYELELTKAEYKTFASGNRGYACTYKVLTGPHAGRGVWNNIMLMPENPGSMRMFFVNMKAHGLGEDFFKASPPPTPEAVAQALVGTRVRAELGVQSSGPYAGRNEVRKLLPALPGSGVVGGPPQTAGVPSGVPGLAQSAPGQQPTGTPPRDLPEGSPADTPRPGF
jgi:hypothetical protein